MTHFVSAFLGWIALVATMQAATGYRVQARYPVPGNGSFDYVTLDAAARRLAGACARHPP